MRNNKTASLFPKELVIESLKQSFVKLNPRMMFRNPIMFIVEVVTFVMLFVTIWAAATGDTTQGSFGYNILVFYDRWFVICHRYCRYGSCVVC